MQAHSGSFMRFLVGGTVNTIGGYALFLVLSTFLHHALAYTISYLAGVAFAYALAATFVFRTGFDMKSAFRFSSLYVAQYFYGLIVLSILIDKFNMPRQIALLVVIVTAIPLTFVLTRHAVRLRQTGPSKANERAPTAD